MHFLYDAQSKIAQVEYNGAIYTYINNFQGDVIGLLDSSGNLVVEYKYDAWGKPLAVEGSLANTLGRGNPFRYREYVYDEETLLYYLRSRYYSHSISRFMVSDWQIVVYDININTYCYCANRATNAHDFDGRTWDDLVQAFKDAMMFSDGGNNKCYGYFRDPSKKSSLPSTGSSSYDDYPSRSCPNPNGRKGGKAHQNTIKEVKAAASEYSKSVHGLTVETEMQVCTPGGYKERRYPDVSITVNGKALHIQVGVSTKGGLPVARERRAIEDLINAGFMVLFIPYK